MENKTVTINYRQHEEMLTELNELRKAKLCVLTVTYHQFSWWGDRKDYTVFQLDSDKELKEKIEEIISEKIDSIISPHIHEVEKLIFENEQLKEKIEKLSKKPFWRFWR